MDEATTSSILENDGLVGLENDGLGLVDLNNDNDGLVDLDNDNDCLVDPDNDDDCLVDLNRDGLVGVLVSDLSDSEEMRGMPSLPEPDPDRYFLMIIENTLSCYS